VTKRLLALTAVFLLTGCALDKQSAPALTGPSELGLSLEIKASPDTLTQDGQSQSFIEVTARDATSQPARGVTFRVETAVVTDTGVVAADFGTLSSRSVSTDNNGKASFMYTAPAAPPPTATQDNLIQIQVSPVGSNYANTVTRSVSVRLKRPNNPLPNGAPVPSFFATPTTAKENDDIFFDGSASTDDGKIMSYSWNFGDGHSGSGKTAHHGYELSGTYQVTLTIVDDAGISVTSAPFEVQVAQQSNPTASFVASPTTTRVGAQVNFNASLSTAPTGRTVVSYRWNFGDGAIGEGVSPVHVYGQANSYIVTLTVTDSTGRIASVSGTVIITP
jgi:PKD repeat protein